MGSRERGEKAGIGWIGAVESCPANQQNQWLSARCGHKAAVDTQREISRAPAPEAAGRRHDPPDKEKAAAPAGDRRNGSSQDIIEGISSSHDGARDASADLPLIDKLGIRHRTAILRAWSATAIRALDVRWAEVGEGGHD